MVRDRVPRVLPALVLEPGLLVAPLVGDVAVALQVGVVVDPGQGRARLLLERSDELGVAGPALVLVEQHDVERRRVDGAVVGRVRPLLERGHLAEAQLVEDAAGVLVAEVVAARPLPEAERDQRRLRELGRERQRLQAGEDAVAAEHRHEPGQPGRRQVVAGQRHRREPQRRQVHEAALVRPLERVPVAGQRGSLVEPLLQAPLHDGQRVLGVPLVLGRGDAESRGAAPGRHVQVGRPLAVRLHVDAERQAVLVHGAGRGRRHPGLAHVGLTLVPEHQAAVVDPRVVLALLLQGVLDLEQVGEVRACLDAHVEVDRLLVVVEDRELLVEAPAHGALADHRELGVDVDGAGARHQEEPGLEVLQVVHRQRVEPLAVDGEHPLGEEPRVEREQAGRIGQRGLDVAGLVADDEGVAVEDLDLGAHDCLLA